MPRTFVVGSRASKLAQVQTYSVKDALETAHPDQSFDVAFMLTGGDKNKVDPLYLFGAAGKALWTEELEAALLKDKTIDFIVHSLKDVPTTLPPGAELGAIIERHDPLDSLVVKKGLGHKTLEDLPDGSIVGSSSVRRVAQLRRAFPKLIFSDMRGNIDTRLAKLDAPDSKYTAIILAHAGLARMNWQHRITSDIVPPHLYHAVGQGAIGIEIRSDDQDAKRLLKALSHAPTEMRCRAERSCLRVLEGGCSVPVGVETIFTLAPAPLTPSASPDATIAELDPTPSLTSSSAPSTKVDSEPYPTLTLTGCVTSLTGDSQVVYTSTMPVTCPADAVALGETVAKRLIKSGAREILDEVNKERAIRDAALKKSKADKGLALPASIAGSSADATGDGAQASVSAPTPSTTPPLPPGHPPIPVVHAPAPIKVPASTINEASPLLPAQHPPILVTPAKDAETPSHCLRPPTPIPIMKEGMVCLRPPTPEAVESFLRNGASGISIDANGGSVARNKRKDVGDEEENRQNAEPNATASSSRKRRAVSSSRNMQG